MSTSTRLQHRPSRTTAAVLVAVLLLLIGVAAVWLGVTRLTSGAWDATATSAANQLPSFTWQSPVAIGITIAAVIIGVVLLTAALRPGQISAVALSSASPGADRPTEFLLGRRSVARLAVHHAADVIGVDRVSATARGSRVLLDVSTLSDHTDAVRDSVVQAVRTGLADAGLEPVPAITATVSTRS